MTVPVAPWDQPVPANPPVPVDLDDVQQHDPGPLALSVKQDGPVTAHELPARVTILESRTVKTASADPQGYRIPRDPRRKRLTLLATDKPFIAGFTQQDVVKGAGAPWPINVPMVLATSAEVWLACYSSTGSDTALVSIIAEYWAD